MLFATPGMLNGGVSLEVFKHWAPDPKNHVVLPGYQVKICCCDILLSDILAPLLCCCTRLLDWLCVAALLASNFRVVINRDQERVFYDQRVCSRVYVIVQVAGTIGGKLQSGMKQEIKVGDATVHVRCQVRLFCVFLNLCVFASVCVCACLFGPHTQELDDQRNARNGNQRNL